MEKLTRARLLGLEFWVLYNLAVKINMVLGGAPAGLFSMPGENHDLAALSDRLAKFIMDRRKAEPARVEELYGEVCERLAGGKNG